MGQRIGPTEATQVAVWEQPLPWLGEAESEAAPGAETAKSSEDPDAASELSATKESTSTPASAGTGGSAPEPTAGSGKSTVSEEGAGARSPSSAVASVSTPTPQSKPQPASEPEPDHETTPGSDLPEESAQTSVAPAATTSEPALAASPALPGGQDDPEEARGGAGKWLRVLVAKAGAAVVARNGARPPEAQTERNVRLIGVVTAISVLAALGLGAVAIMAVPDNEASQPRAARVGNGALPTAGPGDSVLPPGSATPSSSAAADHKDGAPRAGSRSADRGGSKNGSPSSAASRPRSTHADSSSGGSVVGAADSPKAAATKDTGKSQTDSTPTAGTHAGAAGRMIVGYGSSRCVGVSAHKGTDGSPLTLQGCAGEAWQKWVFASDGSVRSMGLCMDIANASNDNGATIQLARCNGGWAQRFTLNSSHDLVNTQIGMCVDTKDMATAAGTPLQLWECGGTSNQKWHLG